MSVVNPTSLSSEERPISLRVRPDLVYQDSVYQGERCWIVKDPLAMKYFRLQLPEYAVLSHLNGQCSFTDLKRMLDKDFPEKTARLEAIQQLVVSLHRNGLLVSNSIGQAKPLRKKRNKELSQKVMGLLSSLVSLKLPGIDPERFLSFLYPKTKWFYSTWFTFAVFTACLVAATLVLSNLSEFYSKLPDFQSFFAFDNLLFMGAILIFTKTIHELGHGLTCKHFGGECHEIGFMFLVMTPAMFCNTSDSWILPNRWHRMAIGAAGMYVEVFMAAICTFIWWYTHPGWIHYLALNIMFLSSVSTILFNANPLLRYDGYYILSDFLEIPNLAQKSKMALLSKLRVWCLGMKPVNSRLLPQRHQVVFAIYSVASFVYRWAVMVMIFWFLSKVFEPWGLAVLGYLMIAFSLIGMLVVPGFKLVKFFLYPGRLREVKRTRLVVSAIGIAAAAAFIGYFPFQQHVWGHFVVRPLDPQMVFVTQPGTLKEVNVNSGDQVKSGDVLAVLENREFQFQLMAMKGELARLENDLTGYELNRDLRLDSERLIIETRGKIEQLKKQIKIKRLDGAPLILRANRDGVVILPPNVPLTPAGDAGLKTWSGTPLDPKNLDAFLDRNTLFCLVADEGKFEAIIVVDQADVGLLQPGQTAKLISQQYRHQQLQCAVDYVSNDELANVARELSQANGGPIAVKPTATGEAAPLLKLFEAHASFDSAVLADQNVELRTGFYGQAKILVGKSSIGSSLLRYVRNIINFR